MTGLPRRGLVQAALGLAALSACAAEGDPPPRSGSPRVDPYGAEQAGITRPERPQAFVHLVVLDLRGRSTTEVLDAIGDEIDALVAGRVADVPEPGDLTVTVGVGAGALSAAEARAVGLTALPTFARDRFDAQHDGGDLVLQVCASDAVAVLAASDHLTTFLGGELRERWSQLGFAGAGGEAGFARNLLGFHDGIVQPRGARELADGVWRAEPHGRSTLLVVRRILLDVAAFKSLPVAHQEAIVGRRRARGAPLSGGAIDAPLDLAAKTASGEYLIPPGAHVRRAHPLATGRPLMLRRGYSFRDVDGSGLLFLAFQRSLEQFVQTQYRLDGGDMLNRYSQVTASGAFWIPPGVGPTRGLGLGAASAIRGRS